jgi:acyl-coenzyme A synthetase/AMP-(fatty) acid ligase
MLEAFHRRVAGSPDRPYIVNDDGSVIEYGSAGQLVARMAAELASGPHEVVAFAENTPRFVLFLVACVSASRSIYIFSEADQNEPVYRWLAARGPAVYDGAALARLFDGGGPVPAPPVSAAALAPPVISFPSSGTTGAKKLLRYRYETLRRRAMLLAGAYGLDESDRFLCTSTLAHGHGLMVHVTPSLVLGGTLGLVRLDRMSVRRLASAYQAVKPTVFSALPSLYDLLLKFDSPLRFGPSKLVLAGSERLDTATKVAFEQRYGVAMVDQFGCAETGPVCLMEHVDGERRVGRILPGKEITYLPTNMARVFRMKVESTTMVDEIVDPDGTTSSPKQLVLNDVVYDERDGHGMRLLGREETIMPSSAGVVSLEQVESELEGRFAETLFLALKTEDGAYELLYAGPRELERGQLGPMAPGPPRTLIRVARIPRNVAGKKVRSRSLLMAPGA